MTNKQQPEDFLPLKPVDFLILVLLTEGEGHGYGLVQEIANRTDGKVKLVPGNFYAILKRLIGEGLLEEATRKSVGSGEDKRRRYYSITGLGTQVAAAEASRMRSLVMQPEVMNLIRDSA
jgi:DNA-binding PadR family transcriptional regulator